jgi:hypothetical protein
VIRASNDPEGARVERWLQTLGRRIFPGEVKRAERPGEPEQGQPDVAVPSWTARDRFAVGERVRGEHERTSKGARVRLLRSRGRRSSQQKASWYRARGGANPATASPVPGMTGSPRRRTSPPGPARQAETSEERSVSRPSCDRGRQRSGSPVRLPQPMGAGGQQPLRSRRGADVMLRRQKRAEALTVKPRGLRSWASRSAKCRPHGGKPTTYERCRGGAERAPRRLASAERPSRDASTWSFITAIECDSHVRTLWSLFSKRHLNLSRVVWDYSSNSLVVVMTHQRLNIGDL